MQFYDDGDAATDDDADDHDDEFRYNDASIHESHLCQNGILISFSNETAMIIMSHVSMKENNWKNLNIKIQLTPVFPNTDTQTTA